ncbi:Anthranilate synthase, aminase component [hydrothermal vent metagenome]|uniref:Anthranilate synthase component 1 n=1 Tax=hydrothermal vent metagenome TaxID=652676 RepID=A0A3B0SG09_9ZZZZ
MANPQLPLADQGKFEAFCTACEQRQPFLLTRRVIDDLTTPVAAMLKLGPDQKNIFLLESVKGGETRGRYSVIGLQPDQKFKIIDGQAMLSQNGRAYEAVSRQPLDAIRDFVHSAEVEFAANLPPMLSGVFGYLGYDAVNWIEDIPLPVAKGLDTPDAYLIRPTLMAVFDSVNQEIILSLRLETAPDNDCAKVWKTANQQLDDLQATLLGPLPTTAVSQEQKPVVTIKRTSNTTTDQFHKMVRRAKQYVLEGDVFQVVLSQRFSTPFQLPAFALYRSLRKNNPSPFLFYLSLDDFCIVGSSPEILVRVREKTVTIRPIAGTRPRGKTEAEDQALEAELLADEKERAEHLMLVDLGRNDAGRIALAGSVEVTKSFIIERYSRVMHLVSNIEAKLAKGKTALDALFSGFPHGTVSGAPKIRAMQIISEMEQDRRGIYAGAVGHFSVHGDLDTCIALRTAVIKDGMMVVQAGGGIVLDSDEEMERQETLHKSQALFDAAAEAWRFV